MSRAINKKKSSILCALLVMMMCLMIPVNAYASTSHSVAKMNALNGLTVTKTFKDYGTTPITNVKIYLNVSNGSDPFMFYLTSPSGTTYSFQPSTTSNTYYTSAFNGETPNGTWTVSVQNLNITYNPTRPYPTTTVTPSITIYP